MEVIGTVGAIVGIVDVVARSITTLDDVRKRYKRANLTIELLYGQLIAIKTALNQIHHLIEESLQDEQHYQLVMNMDIAINSCNLLIRVLDEHISKLEYDENENLTFESRTKVVLESKGVEECLTRLDRQMSALNLIITAYNARNPNRQKEVMETQKSREVFDQIKEDSSSLYVLCDSASFVTQRTRTTTATSKLSMNFAFDAELLQHRAYKSTFRSLLRRSAARQSSATSKKPPKTAENDDPIEQARRSAAIDLALEEDRRQRAREVKVLALGSEAPKLVHHLKLSSLDGYTQEERALYRTMVYHQLLLDICFTIDQLGEMHADTENNSDFENNQQKLESLRNVEVSDGFDFDASDTLKQCAQYCLGDNMPDFCKSYLIENTKRILGADYSPSNDDIVHIQASKRSGPSETRFRMGQLNILVFQAAFLARSDYKKWLPTFDGITSIIYTVDLSCYNQVLEEDLSSNRMTSVISDFETIVNSSHFRRTSVILMLCNTGEFKAKLATDPLSRYFPQYSQGNDINSAAKYILWRFNQVNRNLLNLYPHLVEYSDPGNLNLVFAAVKESIVHLALKDGKIL